MRHSFLIALFSSILFSSCLALPGPEPLFQSRAVIAAHSPSSDNAKFQIWVPYVGQGDATLMIFPNGKNLLIDAGPPGAGKNYILPLLEKLEIHTLDALVVSHYDLDHLGGVPEIFAGKDGIANTDDDIRILAAYDRGGAPWDNSPGYGNYLGTLEESKVPRFNLGAGDHLALDAEVNIRCVAANGVVGDGNAAPLTIDLSPPTYSGRENAASIALLFERGPFRYLSAGDLTGGGMSDGFLTPDVESSLAGLVGNVDALHVNHHGSRSSSNSAFVGLAPRSVFIQAGKDNPYHHPVPEVVERWEQSGAKIYSTKEGQGYLLESGGNGVSVKEIQPL